MNQYLSRPDIQKYLLNYPDATKEEKKELLKWLKLGNSPYSNDRNIVDSSDRPVDFIDAIRTEREYCEEQWSIHLNTDNRMCNILSVAEPVRD